MLSVSPFIFSLLTSMFQLVAYIVKVKISLVKSQDNFKVEDIARKIKASYMKLNAPTH